VHLFDGLILEEGHRGVSFLIRAVAVVLKLNGDKLKKVQAQYRRLRLTQVEGMAMEQAIGLHVPSTKGVAPYSRADLKYDMQTGMIELVPLKKGTLVEEPWTRSMSKSSRRLRNR
jgi:hypothetical protein